MMHLSTLERRTARWTDRMGEAAGWLVLAVLMLMASSLLRQGLFGLTPQWEMTLACGMGGAIWALAGASAWAGEAQGADRRSRWRTVLRLAGIPLLLWPFAGLALWSAATAGESGLPLRMMMAAWAGLLIARSLAALLGYLGAERSGGEAVVPPLPVGYALGGAAVWLAWTGGSAGWHALSGFLWDEAGALLQRDWVLAVPLLAFAGMMTGQGDRRGWGVPVLLAVLGGCVMLAHQQAQWKAGVLVYRALTPGDLLLGGLLPGIALAVVWWSWNRPDGGGPGSSTPGFSILWPLTVWGTALGLLLADACDIAGAAAVAAALALIPPVAKGRLKWEFLRPVLKRSAEAASRLVGLLAGAACLAAVLETVFLRGVEWGMPGTGGWLAAAGLVVAGVALLGLAIGALAALALAAPLLLVPLLMLGTEPVWLAVMLALALLAVRAERRPARWWLSGMCLLLMAAAAALPALFSAPPHWVYGRDFSRLFAAENLAGRDAIRNPHEAEIDF